MRKYQGTDMVNRSRFTAYTNNMDESDRRKLYDMVDILIKENREFCDRNNHQHLCNIFTSMSLYRLLQDKGISEEE